MQLLEVQRGDLRTRVEEAKRGTSARKLRKSQADYAVVFSERWGPFTPNILPHARR